jgi:hypothetical protein
VLEDGPVGVLQVLVQAHTWSALAQDARQGGLAHFDRLPAQIGAVQLQEVEGVQEGVGLVPTMTEQLERSHALLVAAHDFARRSGRNAL